MQSLKITRATGEVYECEITPVMEVNFETYHHGGYRKILRENQMQTDLYWMAWDALKRYRDPVTGSAIDPPIGVFGDDFLATLKKVDVRDDDSVSADVLYAALSAAESVDAAIEIIRSVWPIKPNGDDASKNG